MDTSDYTRGGDGVESSPERTDGGYGHPDESVGDRLTRRLRSVGILSKSTEVDQHVSAVDGDRDVPAIVTWYETLRQGR